jgi:putative protein-disulfide isomerase
MDQPSKDVVLEHWRHVNERTGLPFNDAAMRADGFVYDTEPACRAVVTARHLNSALALELHHAIQRAFYAEGRDVTRAAVLAGVARDCGIEGSAFDEAFGSDAMKEATREDFALAQRVGVNGFPTLCVDSGGRLLLITAGFAPHDAIEQGLARLAGHDD